MDGVILSSFRLFLQLMIEVSTLKTAIEAAQRNAERAAEASKKESAALQLRVDQLDAELNDCKSSAKRGADDAASSSAAAALLKVGV